MIALGRDIISSVCFSTNAETCEDKINDTRLESHVVYTPSALTHSYAVWDTHAVRGRPVDLTFTKRMWE